MSRYVDLFSCLLLHYVNLYYIDNIFDRNQSRFLGTRCADTEFYRGCSNEYHKKVGGCMIWRSISGQKRQRFMVRIYSQLFLYMLTYLLLGSMKKTTEGMSIKRHTDNI